MTLRFSSAVCPHGVLCTVCVAYQPHIIIGLIPQNNRNDLAFVMKMEFVLCEIGDKVMCSPCHLGQCFSIFVRPRPGKLFFYKTRARSQKNYSKIPFQIFKFIY